MSEGNSTVEYRPVKGFPGYRVGDDGSVLSCWRRVGGGNLHGSHHVMGTEWHRLKPHVMKNGGHLRVTLCPGRRRRFVHHLVLDAFAAPRPAGKQCRHFPDRDPANNASTNLQWGTSKENHADRKVHGTDFKGERNGMAKLTDKAVREIRVDFATGKFTKRAIAKKHGVTEHAIRRVVRGEYWKHVV